MASAVTALVWTTSSGKGSDELGAPEGAAIAWLLLLLVPAEVTGVGVEEVWAGLTPPDVVAGGGGAFDADDSMLSKEE